MPEKANLSLKHKLSVTPTAVLLSEERPLYDAEITSTLGPVLDLMNSKEIYSVPIYAMVDGTKEYKGILSIADILAKTVFLYCFANLQQYPRANR